MAQIGIIFYNLKEADQSLHLQRQKNVQQILLELEPYCKKNGLGSYQLEPDASERLKIIQEKLERNKRLFFSLHLAYTALSYLNDKILLDSEIKSKVLDLPLPTPSDYIQFLSKTFSTEIYTNKGWHFRSNPKQKFEVVPSNIEVESYFKIKMTDWIDSSFEKLKAFLQAELLLNNDSLIKSYQIMNLLNELDKELSAIKTFLKNLEKLHERTLKTHTLNDEDKKLYLSTVPNLPRHLFSASALIRRILEGAVTIQNWDDTPGTPPQNLRKFL